MRDRALPPDALAAVAAAYAIVRARAETPIPSPSVPRWTLAQRLGNTPALRSVQATPGTLWRTGTRLG